ncbi:MAG: rod shape-determining protein MreC [Clostridia bacterium]|nr:rod shape-determining protein MreC [Clostridia bacterium]
MYRDNKNSKVGIVITAVILILLVILTNLDNNTWSRIANPFTKLTMSAQSGITYLKNKISKNDDYFASVDYLKNKNEELKKENEELKQKNQELEILKAENKTLKEHTKLADKYSDYDLIPGYVIQRDFSNYSKIVVINVGKNIGVEPGMTVVADGGLVGYIVSAEDNTSKVQTIVDTASAVSGIFAGTDKSLVTRGILDSNNKIKGTYIDNDVVVNEGDNIQTSGIGGIYPKNINIGKVKEIVNTQNKTNRYVYIETSVDFENLTNILVLKN